MVVFGDKWGLKAMHQGQAIILPNVRMSKVLYIRRLKENLFFDSITSLVNEAKVIIENG